MLFWRVKKLLNKLGSFGYKRFNAYPKISTDHNLFCSNSLCFRSFSPLKTVCQLFRLLNNFEAVVYFAIDYKKWNVNYLWDFFFLSWIIASKTLRLYEKGSGDTCRKSEYSNVLDKRPKELQEQCTNRTNFQDKNLQRKC